jgi:hypothetical protein
MFPEEKIVKHFFIVMLENYTNTLATIVSRDVYANTINWQINSMLFNRYKRLHVGYVGLDQTSRDTKIRFHHPHQFQALLQQPPPAQL